MSERIDQLSQTPKIEKPLASPDGISAEKIAEKLPWKEPESSDIWKPKNSITSSIQDMCYKTGINHDIAKNGKMWNIAKACLDGYVLAKIDSIEWIKNLSPENAWPILKALVDNIMKSIGEMTSLAYLSTLAQQASNGGELLMKKISEIAGMPIEGFGDIFKAILKDPYKVTRFIVEQLPLPPGIGTALSSLTWLGTIVQKWVIAEKWAKWALWAEKSIGFTTWIRLAEKSKDILFDYKSFKSLKGEERAQYLRDAIRTDPKKTFEKIKNSWDMNLDADGLEWLIIRAVNAPDLKTFESIAKTDDAYTALKKSVDAKKAIWLVDPDGDAWAGIANYIRSDFQTNANNKTMIAESVVKIWAPLQR
jgi:hypothetical protein